MKPADLRERADRVLQADSFDEGLCQAIEQAYADGAKEAWSAVLVEVLAAVFCLFMLTLAVAVIIAGQQRRLGDQRQHNQHVIEAIQTHCLPRVRR